MSSETPQFIPKPASLDQDRITAAMNGEIDSPLFVIGKNNTESMTATGNATESNLLDDLIEAAPYELDAYELIAFWGLNNRINGPETMMPLGFSRPLLLTSVLCEETPETEELTRRYVSTDQDAALTQVDGPLGYIERVTNRVDRLNSQRSLVLTHISGGYDVGELRDLHSKTQDEDISTLLQAIHRYQEENTNPVFDKMIENVPNAGISVLGVELLMIRMNQRS